MSKAKTANGAPGKPAPLGGTLGKATAPAKAPAAPAKPSVNGSGTVTAFGGPKVPGGLTQPQKDAYVQAGKVIGAPVGNTGKYRSRGDNAYRDNDGNTVIGRDNKAIGPNFGTDFNKTLQGYQNDVGKALPGRNVSPADVSRFGTNTLNNVFGTDKFGNPRDTERETRTFAGEVGGYPTNDLAAAANAFENNITLGRAWGPTMDRFDANGRDKRVKGGANSAYNAANPGTDAYNQALAGRAAAIDPASDFSLTAPKNVITATNYLTPAAERDQAARAKKVGITGSTWSQTPSFQKTRAEYGPHVFGNAEDTANKVAMARGGPIGGPVISQADRNEYSKGKTDKGGFTTASEKTLGEQVANAFAPKPTARPPGVGVAPKPTARPVGSYTAPGLSFNPALPAQMAAPPIPTARPPMQGPVRGFANLPNRQIAERDSYVNQAPVNAVRPAGPLGGFPAAPVNGVRPSGPLGGFPAAPVNGVRPAGPLGGFPAAAPPPTNGVRPAGPLGGFPAAQPVNGVRPAGPLGGFPAAPVNGVRPEGPLGGFPAAPPNMVRPSGPPGGFPAAPVNGVRPEGPPGGFPAAPVNGVRPEGPLGGFPPAAPPEAGRTLKSRVNADGTLTNYWSNDATPEAAPPQAPAAGVMGLSPVNRAVINGLSRLGETLGDVRIPGIPAADPAFAKWAAARKWAPGLADAAAEKVIGPAVREAAANAIRGIQSFT
ncbi:MAG TPA: hypothetical protein VK196_15490, partial [Magnetospirillum sp.]|nr:hypothetical protein [Magnetospirillum sp.]